MACTKGSGGRSFNDRELAGNVRSMALGHLKKVLEDGYSDIEYQRAVLLKLAPSLLPRLNEHSGADGSPLFENESTQKGKQAVAGFVTDEDN